ncbi:hypothetical protein FQN51_006667 [Onygenales sp. PD_10]|nr:hypothetical protein FQN51_006667 [Onygenales sp. PD_10]
MIKNHPDTRLADRTSQLQTHAHSHSPSAPSTPHRTSSPASTTTATSGNNNNSNKKPTPAPQQPSHLVHRPSSASLQLAAARQDLSEAQRSRTELQEKLSRTSSELEKLKKKYNADARRMDSLVAERAQLVVRLRDRDEELRGKAKLLDDIQAEIVSLNLEINMSDQKAKKLEAENKELVDRWMARMGKEADAMNEACPRHRQAGHAGKEGILNRRRGHSAYGQRQLNMELCPVQFQLIENARTVFETMFGFFKDLVPGLEIIRKEVNPFKGLWLVITIAKRVFISLRDFWIYAVETYRNPPLWVVGYQVVLYQERIFGKLRPETMLLKNAAQLKAPDDATDLKKAPDDKMARAPGDETSSTPLAAVKLLLGQLYGFALEKKDRQFATRTAGYALNDKPLGEQDFVLRVFQWVVGSIRPLRSCEVGQTLQIHQFRGTTYEDDDEEFLQEQIMQSTAIPVELSKYFIDVMTSNEMFATACLNVLQSPSVWSNDYFQVSVKPHHIRASLITLGPLLEYAVLYWPGFACTFAEAISKEDYPFVRGGLLAYHEPKQANADVNSLLEPGPKMTCGVQDGEGPKTGTYVDFPIDDGPVLDIVYSRKMK